MPGDATMAALLDYLRRKPDARSIYTGRHDPASESEQPERIMASQWSWQ